METRGFRKFASFAIVVWPMTLCAQNPVRVTQDVLEASTLGVPIDPTTRVDRATMPRDIGRRALERLGLTAERLATARAATYSVQRLEDGAGALQVFYTSVVKEDDRWVFWAEDLPKDSARGGAEMQLRLATQSGTRYLVDFVLDSAEQQFAVVSGDTRTTQAAEAGHIALIVTGTGKDHTIRVIPLGDAAYKSRRFTLFHVTVTPIA
jgi:hypothetical protein